MSYWFVNARKRLWKPYINEEREVSHDGAQVGKQVAVAQHSACSCFPRFRLDLITCDTFSLEFQPATRTPIFRQELDGEAFPCLKRSQEQSSLAEPLIDHFHGSPSIFEITAQDSIRSGALACTDCP